MVHGIELDERDDPGESAIRQRFERPENGSEVEPHRREHAPKVDHVAEEHCQRRDEVTNSKGEQREEDYKGRGQQDHCAWDHPEKRHDTDDGNEREAEVDDGEQDLLGREDDLLDADLLDKGRIIDDGTQRSVGAVLKDGKERLPQYEIDGKRVHVELEPEDVREDEGHHDHHEQGVENAPGYAQHAAPVLELELLRDEIVEEVQAVLVRAHHAVFGSKSGLWHLVSCIQQSRLSGSAHQ